MITSRFCYAVSGDKPNGTWKLIPDTPESRQLAIEKGCRHFSIYSFSDDPSKNNNTIRYGDLIMDFYSKIDPIQAIKDAQNFIYELCSIFKISHEELRYWLSGNKGCHIAIPYILYGGEEGDIYLPQIHSLMVRELNKKDNGLNNICNTIDLQLYSMGKGHVLRIENLIRNNGYYKVPLTAEEFFHIENTQQINEYIKSKRYITINNIKISRNESFHSFYLECMRKVNDPHTQTVKSAEYMDRHCQFIKHCKDNAEKLGYNEWFAMISNFSRLGSLGRELIHFYSQPYPKYNKEETEKKIKEANGLDNPYSCEYIKNNIYPCSMNCKLKYPYMLYLQEENKISEKFFLKNDGLYYIKYGNSLLQIKICSYIEVIALSHNPHEQEWGRIIRLTNPKGTIRTVVIAMSEIITSPDIVLRKLMDLGVQLEDYKQSKSLLLEYLCTCKPSVYGTVTKKSGWHGDVYIIKDNSLGRNMDEIYILDNSTEENLMTESGTLEEWKEHIGVMCKGQSLLQLAISFSFTGILLTPCSQEGGALHYFGPSSTGKTTALIVAGSTYGGGPKGYIRQWRATDNALESIAALHNDGFLCLDEIGQASSKVVSEVAYMLPNGQGRARANRDGNAKEIKSWNIVFMSTGELTLADSIALDSNRNTMAGQNVRILDIPCNAGKGYGVFSFIPNGLDANKFSQLLVQNAKKYYGTPARAFIQQFSESFESNSTRVKDMLKDFVDKNTSMNMSGQVKRGCQRFGLIAAAGELAIEWGILPWERGEANSAALFGYQAWIQQRGGTSDMEITNAINRLKDFIETSGCRFLPVDSNYPIQNFAGYKWHNENRAEEYYGFIPVVFRREICRTLNPNTLIDILKKHNCLGMTKNGSPMNTRSISGRSVRVIVVIPNKVLACRFS